MSNFITPITSIDTLKKQNIIENTPESGIPFQKIFDNVLKNFEQASQVSQNDNLNLSFGDINDLSQMQINSLKAQAMLQTTVQITSRAVNSYKEIMQMQI